MMHKQVSVQLTSNSKFLSKFSRKPLSGISDQRAPPSPMENFRLQVTKVYSEIPPPPHGKIQIWDDQSLLQNTPPQRKTSDLRWPKFTPKYPPKWKTSDLRWPKFTLKYPPTPNGKLQIWDDQSLLRNTPSLVGLESGRSYVEPNLYPPWIPSRLMCVFNCGTEKPQRLQHPSSWCKCCTPLLVPV